MASPICARAPCSRRPPVLAAVDNLGVAALEAGERPSLLREPLRGGCPLDAVLRCLHGTSRPFALAGAWAGGGVLLGCSPVRVAADSEDPFALIAGVARDDPGSGVGGGWVGYLGYRLGARVERGQPAPPLTQSMPAFVLGYYDHVVRRDAGGRWWFEALWTDGRARELEDRLAWWTQRLADPPLERPASTCEWRLTPSAEGHAELVAACRERIYAGDLYQANVCAELEGRIDGSPLELFIRGVETLAPDRAAYLEGPWGAIVSLSPELFLKRHGRGVRTAPIKGTRRRPADPVQASAERRALVSSVKERAENVMIVDLMRNDLGRVCEPGSIVVESLAQARAHTGVWHLVSEIRGLLRPEVDDGQLLRATFPPGSVTGAPKIAATNVIAELESTAREVYTGAIGIAGPVAGLELSVAIRTFEVTGSTIRLGVGGGVVADSDPDAEAAELAVKAAPLLEALGAAAVPAAARRGHSPRVRRLGPVPIPRPDLSLGVFETLLVCDRRALCLDLHLARLGSSVLSLYGTSLPASTTLRIQSAARTTDTPSRLRVDALPNDFGMVEIAVRVRPLVPIETARVRVWTLPGGLGSHKWTDRRLVEAIEARSPGELPLLVDADGHVLEATRASVFALGCDGVLRTPPDDGRILPGIARAQVLAHAQRLGLKNSQAPLLLDDLLHAQGVILTSALRHTPVLAIDGRELTSQPNLTALVQCALNASAAPRR